jgi:DNA-binding Xre family transcriptional regulator
VRLFLVEEIWRTLTLLSMLALVANLSTMRLRLPELLGGMTPYRLAKESGGRISLSTAYRLVRKNGRLANFDAEMLAALCDVLNAKPGELLEYIHARKGKRG